MSYGYLYITTNLINNKRYVGQHIGEFDSTYFGSGHGIKNAIKHYGIQWFRVDFIKYFESREELDKAEIKLIKNYREIYSLKALYNQSNGGTGGDNIKYNSNPQEVYKRISDKLKGRPGKIRYWLGKHHSEESNKKRSEKLKGRTFTPECRELRGRLQEGNKRACGKGKRQQGLLMAIHI